MSLNSTFILLMLICLLNRTLQFDFQPRKDVKIRGIYGSSEFVLVNSVNATNDYVQQLL